MATVQDLGIVTSYAYAVAGGYNGTVEDYEHYLATLPTYTDRAAASATASANSAETSQSWAVGGTGTRSGEDTNNSKFWCDQAHAITGLFDFVGATDLRGGQTGLVPAPDRGEENYALFGDGAWRLVYLTFTGTKAQWNALSSAQKKPFKNVILTDE